jgi:hypothetical protein
MNYHATCLKTDWLTSSSTTVQPNNNPHVHVGKTTMIWHKNQNKCKEQSLLLT